MFRKLCFIIRGKTTNIFCLSKIDPESKFELIQTPECIKRSLQTGLLYLDFDPHKAEQFYSISLQATLGFPFDFSVAN